MMAHPTPTKVTGTWVSIAQPKNGIAERSISIAIAKRENTTSKAGRPANDIEKPKGANRRGKPGEHAPAFRIFGWTYCQRGAFWN